MYGLLFAAAMLCPTNAAQQIRQEIDNACGDSWCEGEYAYEFKKVFLDPKSKSTLVTFTMSIADEEALEDGATLQKQSFDVSCRIAGYSTYAQIMDGEHSLNWDFYMRLSDCINRLEERLSR